MSEVRVFVDLGPNSKSSVVPIEIIPVKGRGKRTYGMVNGQKPLLLEEMQPGTYVVRAKLPSGRVNQKVLKVPGPNTVQIVAEAAGNEDLNLVIQSRPQVNRSFAQDASVSKAESTEPLAIWDMRSWETKGTLSRGRYVALERYSAPSGGVQGRYRLPAHPIACAEFKSHSITRWLALPPDMESQVIVFDREGAPDDLGVSVTTMDSKLESLLSILQARTSSLTDAASSGNAESLLRKKYASPFPAVVGAYVLLRAGYTDTTIKWLHNLTSDFSFADPHLILGKLLTLAEEPLGVIPRHSRFEDKGSRDSIRYEGVVECLLQSMAVAPFPVLTEGFRLFQELLHFVDSESTGRSEAPFGKACKVLVNASKGQRAKELQNPQRISERIASLRALDWNSRYTALVMEKKGRPWFL